jgi:hypothetical protein
MNAWHPKRKSIPVKKLNTREKVKAAIDAVWRA